MRSLRRAVLTPILLSAVALCLSATPSLATVSYDYLGNPFTNITDVTPPAGTFTTSDRIVASFEFAAALAPDLVIEDLIGTVTGISITAGRGTLTDPDDLAFFFVSTDSFGDIIEWSFGGDVVPDVPTLGDQFITFGSVNSTLVATGDTGGLGECVAPPCDTNGVTGWALDGGTNADAPGTWTFVPEPSTALLTGLGLVAVSLRRGR